MIPASFISKWSRSELKVRFTEELGGGDGCKKGCFAIKYKGKRKNLGAGNEARYTPNTTFETLPFPEGMRKTEKNLNWDEGDKRDEKQKQASFSVSLSSPSSLLINLSALARKPDEVLGLLLALNLDRARLQAGGQDAGTH